MPQRAHLAGRSGDFIQVVEKCLPPHLTHMGLCAVSTSVAVRLAVLALWNLSLFVGFFNFDFRMQKRGYREDIAIAIVWI